MSYYHETLKESPEAQQYLVKRGLQSAEMVEHFRLGFANRTLGYHLPASNRRRRRGATRTPDRARRLPRKRARALQRFAGDSDF